MELVCNGKTNTVCNVVLPFQTIEQVDEPRAEQPLDAMEALQTDLFSTDPRGRQLKGWTNKLIWGYNKLILSSLKNGPLREQIEAQGDRRRVVHQEAEHSGRNCLSGYVGERLPS